MGGGTCKEWYQATLLIAQQGDWNNGCDGHMLLQQAAGMLVGDKAVRVRVTHHVLPCDACDADAASCDGWSASAASGQTSLCSF
jgi:hypothetical protein